MLTWVERVQHLSPLTYLTVETSCFINSSILRQSFRFASRRNPQERRSIVIAFSHFIFWSLPVMNTNHFNLFPHPNHLAPVVGRVDNAIHWINLYPLNSAVDTYRLDSDLSAGQRYPAFKQLGPGLLYLRIIFKDGHFQTECYVQDPFSTFYSLLLWPHIVLFSKRQVLSNIFISLNFWA